MIIKLQIGKNHGCPPNSVHSYSIHGEDGESIHGKSYDLSALCSAILGEVTRKMPEVLVKGDVYTHVIDWDAIPTGEFILAIVSSDGLGLDELGRVFRHLRSYS